MESAKFEILEKFWKIKVILIPYLSLLIYSSHKLARQFESGPG